MSSPACAIAWEIWRKNRVGNLICLACIAVFVIQAMAWAFWRPPTRTAPALNGDAMVLVIFPMLATFVWVFNIFAHTERDARKGFSGVPMRMFTLPVQTAFLVGCLMIYGVVAISGVYLAWVELVFRPFGVVLPLGWPLLVLAVGMSSFQTAVWGLASFPWIRMGIISVGAVALIVVSAVGFSESSTGWLNSRTATVLLLAWLPLTYAGAVFGVKAERHGGWHAWASVLPPLRRILDTLPRWRGPFRSAAQAQFWFEWRRKGWFLTIAMAFSIAGGILLFPAAVILDERSSLPVLAFLSMLLLPLQVSGSGGAEMAKSDFWSSEKAIQPFHAARPLSDAALVIAKLKVATVITLLGWLLAALLGGLLASWTRWRELWMVRLADLSMPWSMPLPAWGGYASAFAIALLAIIAITWHSMVASLSVGLIGRKNVITAWSLVGMVLVFGAVTGVGWFYLHPTNRPFLLGLFHLGILALTLWKMGDFIHAFAEVRRRELLDSRAVWFAFFLWLAVAMCLLAGAGVLWQQTPTPRPLLLFLLVWFWPAGELPRCVLNLAANRHR